MIPILFNGNETQFTSNGIGRLSDAVSCSVTEVRNGAYELEMEYPVDGIHFSDIALGCYIFCKPSKGTNNQAFEIYKISKPISGIVSICAEHISYRLDKTPCMPFTAANVGAALSGLKTNAAESCPFTFTTNKSTVAAYKQKDPAPIRERLGGVEGSILDVYGGGDYEFDMFTVKLWGSRGSNRGYSIRYGKNMTDLRQEESIAETITGIVPYFANETVTVTLTEKVLESASAASYPYHRTVPVDLSSSFPNSIPSESELRAEGQRYLNTHSIGVPKVSLTVSFVNLADTTEYKDVAALQDVKLCDTVNVYFEKLGVNAMAKVIKTVYDSLNEKYTSIELGDARATLSSRIAAAEKTISDTPSAIQTAVNHATNLITGELGGYVVFNTNEEGKPYEILIMDNQDKAQAVNVWRWNQSGWGHSSSGYNGPYTLAATLDGGFVADFITTGQLTSIMINNGNGTFTVDANGNMKATSGEFTGSIKSGSSITGATINNGNGTFTVDANGNMTAAKATITGGSITVGQKFAVDANGNMTATDAQFTGAVKAGSSITGATINVGNGTFSVDANGNMTASSATITGGTITVGQRFSVDASGNMTATNADFTGDIKSGSTIQGAAISAGTMKGTVIRFDANDTGDPSGAWMRIDGNAIIGGYSDSSEQGSYNELDIAWRVNGITSANIVADHGYVGLGTTVGLVVFDPSIDGYRQGFTGTINGATFVNGICV